MVATSTKALAAARAAADPKQITAEFRRAEEDILILTGLGTYYAHLFRAASSLLASISRSAECLSRRPACQQARDAWAAMADHAKKVYAADISYGSTSFRRGHWADRLAAIDDRHHLSAKANFAERSKDFVLTSAPMRLPAREPLPSSPLNTPHPSHSTPATISALTLTRRPTSPKQFSGIAMSITANAGSPPPCNASANTHSAAIPAAYTDSPYPLQYYFELHTANSATLHPAFNPTLTNQPYFAIHKRT